MPLCMMFTYCIMRNAYTQALRNHLYLVHNHHQCHSFASRMNHAHLVMNSAYDAHTSRRDRMYNDHYLMMHSRDRNRRT